MKSFLLTAALVAGVAAAGWAQAPTSTGPTPQSPTDVPLDGGAGLLLAGGVAYGLRKLRQRQARP